MSRCPVTQQELNVALGTLVLYFEQEAQAISDRRGPNGRTSDAAKAASALRKLVAEAKQLGLATPSTYVVTGVEQALAQFSEAGMLP